MHMSKLNLLKSATCISCKTPIGEHSHKQLIRCLAQAQFIIEFSLFVSSPPTIEILKVFEQKRLHRSEVTEKNAERIKMLENTGIIKLVGDEYAVTKNGSVLLQSMNLQVKESLVV